MAARAGGRSVCHLVDMMPEAGVMERVAVRLELIGLIDWNEPSRTMNAFCNRQYRALAKPDRAERRAAIGELEADNRDMATEDNDPKRFVFFIRMPPKGP